MPLIQDWLDRQGRDDPELHRQLLNRLVERPGAARDGFRAEAAGGGASLDVVESIIRAARPAFLVRDGEIVDDDGSLSGAVDELSGRVAAAAGMLRRVLPLVGRVEAERGGWVQHIGTGWLVAPQVLVTNRHVASAVARREGRGFAFRSSGPPGENHLVIDYRREHGRTAREAVPISRVIWIEPDGAGPDIAFLTVEEIRDKDGPDCLVVSPEDPALGTEVAVVGYPARASIDSVPDQELMERIYKGVYGVKRVSPGRIGPPSDGSATHDCTTLGGSSGSAVVDLTTGMAVGLHFAGRFLFDNYAVPSSMILRRLHDRPWEGGLHRAGADGPLAGGSDPATTNALHSVFDASRSLEEALVSFRAWARHREIVAIRQGYLLRDGTLSDRPCIAVSVWPGSIGPIRSALPERWADWPIELRTASIDDQLRSARAPAALDEVVSATSYDDDARTTERFTLDTIEEVMTIDCHVGPERGWERLESFLTGTSDELVCGIYEFHAAHVAQAVETVLSQGAIVTLVMSPQSKDRRVGVEHAGDFARRETFERWETVHGPRFARVFVPMGAAGLVANAYHIKVAVRDSAACWLSSGNWKRASQPIVPTEDLCRPRALARVGNREWHLIVESPTLAAKLREHLLADFRRSEALGGLPETVDAEGLQIDVRDQTDEWTPHSEAAPREAFEPMRITKRLRVRPLLTPDGRGSALRQAILEMIRSAERRISIQQQYISLMAEPDGELNKMVEALIDAASSKLVRILLRPGGGGLRGNLEALKSKGLDVTRCVRVLDNTHVKGIIVDGTRIVTGSHNWSEAALTLNRDASLLIDDAGVAGYFEQVFDMDWDRARKPSFRPDNDYGRMVSSEERAASGFTRMSLGDREGSLEAVTSRW